MCPNCRAFITTSDRVCPYCNERVADRAIDTRNPGALLGGLIPAARFTTSLLLLLNIGVYIASMYGGSAGSELFQLGNKNDNAILRGHEWWRLITAGFLHVNLFHIGMNMWVLNDLGVEVERTFGTARFLVVYFVGTCAGFLASTYLSSNPSVGASAGICGLIGAMIAFGVLNRTEVGRRIRSSYLTWALYVIVIGMVGIFRTDNYAHLGGLAGGFAVAYVAGTPVHSGRVAERFWQGLAVVCVLITAYSFWIVYALLMQYRNVLPSSV